MSKIKIDKKAPDFNLDDFRGDQFRLSDYVGKKIVILVFNRGFV